MFENSIITQSTNFDQLVQNAGKIAFPDADANDIGVKAAAHQVYGSIFAVATILHRHFHHFDKSPERIKLCIVGAESEREAKGMGYWYLLPMLLGANETYFEINLVGPGLTEPQSDEVGRTQIRIQPGSLEEVYGKDTGDVPDDTIYILLHPGFEVHEEDWFEDFYFQNLLNTGACIYGCSYSRDEAALDRIIANKYEADFIDMFENPYFIWNSDLGWADDEETFFDLDIGSQFGSFWQLTRPNLYELDVNLSAAQDVYRTLINTNIDVKKQQPGMSFVEKVTIKGDVYDLWHLGLDYYLFSMDDPDCLSQFDMYGRKMKNGDIIPITEFVDIGTIIWPPYENATSGFDAELPEERLYFSSLLLAELFTEYM